MSESADMNAPVTRRELEEILDKKFDEILDRKLDVKLRPFVTREELREILEAYPTRDEMFAELARGFGAMQEWMRDQFRASNELMIHTVQEAVRVATEPFRDHGPRITALEAKMFRKPPPRRARRRS